MKTKSYIRTSAFKEYVVLKPYLLLLILFAPALISAQVLGGAQAANTSSDSVKPHNGDEIFSSIKIGIIIPQGVFGQKINTPAPYPYNGINPYIQNSLVFPFKGLSGLGATIGYNLQYEGFSYLSKFQMGAINAHFGLQYGFDFGYMPISFSNVQWGDYGFSVGTSPFLYGGFKVGPAFYINPTPGMGIGVYAVIDPYLSVPGGENATYNNTDASGNTTVATYDVRDTSSTHVNINFSAGINFYYKAFIIGLEYSWVHTKYSGSASFVQTVTENGNSTSTTINSTFGDVLETDMLKVTIGIRLGYGGKARRGMDYDDTPVPAK